MANPLARGKSSFTLEMHAGCVDVSIMDTLPYDVNDVPLSVSGSSSITIEDCK